MCSSTVQGFSLATVETCQTHEELGFGVHCKALLIEIPDTPNHGTPAVQKLTFALRTIGMSLK